MITSGAATKHGHVRFKLDGVVKTLPEPITGLALHTIAGHPSSLTSEGVPVPKDHTPFDVSEDQEFVSAHGQAMPAPAAAGEHIPEAEQESAAASKAKVFDTTNYKG